MIVVPGLGPGQFSVGQVAVVVAELVRLTVALEVGCILLDRFGKYRTITVLYRV